MEINKENILDFMREKLYKPMNINELEKTFNITDSSEFKEFVKLMNQLENDGEVIRTRTNTYGLPEK